MKNASLQIISFFFCLLILTCVPAVQAADLTIDILTFKADSGRAYLELHLDLPRHALTFVQDDSGWFGAVAFTVLIGRDSLTLAKDEWLIEDTPDTSGQITSGQHIVDSRIYEVSPGPYTILVSAIDSLSGKRIQQVRNIEIEAYPDSRFNVSDVQLSAHLLKGSIHPRFDRGGFSIIPNPRKLYDPSAPVVYYFEVYPPINDSSVHDYSIWPALLNNTTTPIKTIPAALRTSNEPFAVVDTFSISEFPGDSYYFQVYVSDGVDTVSRRAKFLVYRPDGALPGLVEIGFDSAQVIEEFSQVAFLITDEQISRVKQMSVKDKALFLNQFWMRYDDDLSTPDVPLRNIFRSRIEEADRRWTNSRTAGHITDRGRVYVVHGDPDDRETHPLDSHAKPYEIWTYNGLQGGVIFAFVDRSALGEFTLMHSTFRGEVFNPDWYESYVIKSTPDTRK